MSAFTWPPEGAPSADLTPVAGGGAPARDARAAVEQISAAVLVPLYLAPPEREPYLVLTRRRADLRRHAGEIAFPGGRSEHTDASLADTALREAEEEIGLSRERVSLIGELPSTSTFATNYVIHPFVATIPDGVAWQPSAREVDAVLELALSDVQAGRTTTQLERRGITFTTDAFVVHEHVIWGATARIIHDLLQRLRGGGRDGGSLELLASPPPSAGGAG